MSRTLHHYPNPFDDADEVYEDEPVVEIKGGKPSKGTPADGRLKENAPAKKPPFPGAAQPFGKGSKGKGSRP